MAVTYHLTADKVGFCLQAVQTVIAENPARYPVSTQMKLSARLAAEIAASTVPIEDLRVLQQNFAQPGQNPMPEFVRKILLAAISQRQAYGHAA
jgi:hypothetical protein